jgi:hypothetical protein
MTDISPHLSSIGQVNEAAAGEMPWYRVAVQRHLHGGTAV